MRTSVVELSHIICNHVKIFRCLFVRKYNFVVIMPWPIIAKSWRAVDVKQSILINRFFENHFTFNISVIITWKSIVYLVSNIVIIQISFGWKFHGLLGSLKLQFWYLFDFYLEIMWSHGFKVYLYKNWQKVDLILSF